MEGEKDVVSNKVEETVAIELVAIVLKTTRVDV